MPICPNASIQQSGKVIPIWKSIVVTDGSTDGASEIAHTYAGYDSRIKVIDKPNGGLVMARKSGLDASNGNYIRHLDGDDYLALDAVDSRVRLSDKNGADIATAPVPPISCTDAKHGTE